ncbi:DUF308 domain-containing protein [Lutibacter sp.]|uniref:HdeD family acid-resistance protein n=1 Tax=Lutibacter sp. TaxID=1925666 RepID=UPI0025B8EA44|nr:DUF308 domain-containing protein [Lutibacter sp.]MCF6180425.1 DUF308 domain-containing protein [Lutibacter sp.]
MRHNNKIAKNWWLLSIVGILITFLGFWVYQNPLANYIGLSVLFSVILFISGVFEIIFAITNKKILKSWGWMLTSGIFDLIIGVILIAKENLSMEILPIVFGIWLIFKGVSMISRGFLLKEMHLSNWGWPIFGGIFVAGFGFMVVYSPSFGASSIVIWTSMSLILLGILTILFSFLIKKVQNFIAN